MKFRKMWNPDAILRVVIYIMMILGLGYGLYSKRLLRYVAPRSIKYVLFMIVVLSFLLIMEFRNVRRIREKKMRSVDYLFFFVPLLLAFTTAPVVVKGSAVKTSNIGVRKTEPSKKLTKEESKLASSSLSTEENRTPLVPTPMEEAKKTEDTEVESESIPPKQADSSPEEMKTEPSSNSEVKEGDVPEFSAPVETDSSEGDQTGDEFIEEPYPIGEWTPVVPPKDGEVKVVDENNYFSVLTSIEEEGDKWNGKKIEISGFVHSDETLSDREFLLVRMLMKCCAVDTDPLILLSVLPKGMEMPKNDEWFVLRGTLRTKPIVETGLWVPTLEVEVMAPIPEPENFYIYPI